MKLLSPTHLLSLLAAQGAFHATTTTAAPVPAGLDRPLPHDTFGAGLGPLTGGLLPAPMLDWLAHDSFAPPATPAPRPPVPPLTAEEERYLCFSIDDAVARYIELGTAGGRAVDGFEDRFRAIYRQGRKARFFAAGELNHRSGAPDAARWNDWAGSADKRRTESDLHSFHQRMRQADGFLGQWRQARDRLYRSIAPSASAGDRAKTKSFIDAELRVVADRASTPISQGAIPMPYYPDVSRLQKKVDAFVQSLARPAPESTTARAAPGTTTTSGTTTGTTSSTAQDTTRASTGPRDDRAHTNRQIADINRFYVSNSTRIMGAAHQDAHPNLAALQLLGKEGVVTFCGPNALDDALRYGVRAHQPFDAPGRWKYGPQQIVDADRHHRIPIKRYRIERHQNSQAPWDRYVEIALLGDRYQIDGQGPWKPNPHATSETLESAKYLRLSAMIKQSGDYYDQIRARDLDHDPRDFTGYGWIPWLARKFNTVSGRLKG